MATELKTETLIVLGVALAGIYLVNRAGQAVVKTAKELVPYVDPTDERNLANQAAEGLWHLATGSTGTIGGDLYDYLHKGDPIFGAPTDPMTGLTPAYNYTVQQQAADLKATRQLEAGFHGM